MADLSVIFKYFSHLTAQQLLQFAALEDLYKYRNERINVISRKDINHLYEHHVLHSLAVAKIISFNKHAEVMDLGTGGGFPGIPLAIYFPETKFTLVDSVGKKIKVVNEVAASLGLKNVTAVHDRAENIKMKFDFIVTRATGTLDELMTWGKGKIKKESRHELRNGLFALKGGNLSEELKKYLYKPDRGSASLRDLSGGSKVFEIKDFFEEKFFESKKVVYMAAL